VRVRQIEADDTVLEILYQRVTLFVATSLAEGFGLPVIEAMSAGCPVAISNIAAFREVVGDAGLFHAPNDSVELADNIMSVLGDPAGSADLARLGRARSLLFTWRRSAELTAAAYQTLLP
ncbi:MAG: glycosyltransferase, partial [Microthrixaceae bacterium]